MREAELPKLAIRPYPVQHMRTSQLKNGMPVVLRPIRPEDEPLLVEFHRQLSENSVRQRYFEFMSLDERVAHERLMRLCFIDYDREWTSVAEIDSSSRKELIGVGRLFRIPGTDYAHFTMAIVDQWHHKGLGTQILEHLLHIAQREGIRMISSKILSENEGMLKICKRLGFEIVQDKDRTMSLARWKA